MCRVLGGTCSPEVWVCRIGTGNVGERSGRSVRCSVPTVPVTEKTYLFQKLYIEAIIRNPKR